MSWWEAAVYLGIGSRAVLTSLPLVTQAIAYGLTRGDVRGMEYSEVERYQDRLFVDTSLSNADFWDTVLYRYGRRLATWRRMRELEREDYFPHE